MGKVWQLPSSGSPCQEQHLTLCLDAWLLSYDTLGYCTVGCGILLWLVQGCGSDQISMSILSPLFCVTILCANQGASHGHHAHLLATPGGVLWIIFLCYRKRKIPFINFELFPYICYFILVLHQIGQVHILICVLLFCIYRLSASICRSIFKVYT